MFRRLVALVAPTLLACAGSSPLARVPSARPRSEPATVVQLIEAAARGLDAVGDACPDTCCIVDQPWWKRLASLSDVDGVSVAQVRAELRSIIEDTQNPRTRALAIIWLSRDTEPDDVRVIEPFVTRSEVVWKEPAIVPLQQGPPCQPFSHWESRTLGGVALRALESILSTEFSDAAAYAAWRARHADAGDSLEYWQQKSLSVPCAALVDMLGAKDRELLIRFSVFEFRTSDPSVDASVCPGAKELARVRELVGGSARLLAYLNDPAIWPSPRAVESETTWRDFAIWALVHSDTLLRSAHSDPIVALTKLAAIQNDSTLLSLAVVAACGAEPTACERLVNDASLRIERPTPEFAYQVAKYEPTAAVLKRWFLLEPKTLEWDWLPLERRSVGGAIARGLLDTGGPGIEALKELWTGAAASASEHPRLINTLSELAVERGGQLEPFCRAGLEYVCHKVPVDVCDRQKQRVERNRRACIVTITRWLTSVSR